MLKNFLKFVESVDILKYDDKICLKANNLITNNSKANIFEK